MVELNNELIFHDEYGMPSMYVCTEKESDRIVLTRRQCCGMKLSMATDGEGDYWEFCLKCKKEYKRKTGFSQAHSN